jgi:hypothetical protein
MPGDYGQYQVLIGRAQGGAIFFVKSGGLIEVQSGGEVEIQSGGTLDVQSGALVNLQVAEAGVLGFFSTDFTGAQLRDSLLSPMTVTEYNSTAALSTNLNVSVLSPAYGYCVFSVAAGISTASIKLPSGNRGAFLELVLSQITSNAAISVLASTGGGTTGVSLVTLLGSALSSLELTGSTPVDGRVVLACTADDTWAVVKSSANVTERAAA